MLPDQSISNVSFTSVLSIANNGSKQTNKHVASMLTISWDSGVINGLFFIFADVIALGLILDGLCALQEYYIYYIACRVENVTLARSRIPLVAGDLF